MELECYPGAYYGFEPGGLRRNQELTFGDTETKHFIYFYLGHCAILLFKTQ